MNSTLESKIANLFSMSDETWERHANPWSVWTRFTILPFIVAAVWSRVWIGSWAWAPVVLTILWTWYNPRMFRKPSSTNNWASMAVLGERVWLNRKGVPVPPHHRTVPNLLSGLASLGLPFIVWGLIRLEFWPTLVGILFTYAGKVWFLDRMVWLFRDMKDTGPEYAAWLYDDTPDPELN
jgi:hypothetical protein